jgi:hypothetical protein
VSLVPAPTLIGGDGAHQLEAEEQFSGVPVDGFGTRVAMLLLELSPRFVPQPTAGTLTVDPPMDVLRNHDGELVDVLDALSREPVCEVSRLGKDVVTDVAARGQLRWRGPGIKVAVEAESENGFGALRPLSPYSPPASR